MLILLITVANQYVLYSASYRICAIIVMWVTITIYLFKASHNHSYQYLKVKMKPNPIPEILYRITVYEKGLVDTRKAWRSNEKQRIIQTMHFIQGLVDLSLTPSPNAIPCPISIIQFIDQNMGIIFTPSTAYTQWKESSGLIQPTPPTDEDRHLLHRIQEITHQVIDEITQHRKEYKIRVWRYIHSLHNLPRGLSNIDSCSLLGTAVPQITYEEALEYSNASLHNMML